MLHISERAEELKLNLKLPAWVWLESPLSYQKNAGKIKNEAQAAMAMAKWISRALAFVKVFAARLECPFAKSSAGCSQSVIQTAPAASSPVCVSLKSIKMLQIKLKVSTFFAPTLLLSHIRLRLEPRLGSDWDLDSDADAGLDSDSGSDSDSVEVWLRLHLHAQHFQMTITNLFAAHFTSQQHFCQFSFCWKLLFNFFVNCWSYPLSLSLARL